MAGVENVRAALETALNAISPAIATVYESTDYTPVSGTAYQKVFFRFATPVNIEWGSRHQEVGYMQVDLLYPALVGTATANTRIELLRSTFSRGSSFVSSGVTVNIINTPSIKGGNIEADRWVVSVIINFSAQIG